MTDTFPLSDHIDLARDFLGRAEAGFASGDTLVGAELLWGAAAHALIAVALKEGWPYDSHGALKTVAKWLLDVPGLPEWLSEFNTAERFHTHFYHGRLTDRRIAADRLKVRRFVGRLLALAE